MTTKRISKRVAAGRVKPAIAKAGVTKNRNRRYGCGGNLKVK